MSDIGLPPCKCDERGHIIGASGMCQWCHRVREDLEHEWMQAEIERLTNALATANTQTEAEKQARTIERDCTLRLLAESNVENERMTRELARVSAWAYCNSCYKHGWQPYFEHESNIDKILRPYSEAAKAAGGDNGITRVA